MHIINNIIIDSKKRKRITMMNECIQTIYHPNLSKKKQKQWGVFGHSTWAYNMVFSRSATRVQVNTYYNSILYDIKIIIINNHKM